MVTSDKGFGARVFERREQHHGVILLRVDDERPAVLISVLAGVIAQFGESLRDRFVVASERKIRTNR